MTDDCRFRDDVGPWVLNALGEPDASAFAAHLETCDGCRREVAELQVVADVLPMAAPQVLPSPDLKNRIMATVHAEAELLRAAGPEADRVPTPRERRRREGGRFGWLRPLPTALATACAVALVVVVVALSGGGDKTTTYKGTGPTGTQVALKVTKNDKGQLVFTHMPAPPNGRVYQVWLVTGKQNPRPTHALFSVSKDGSASIEIPESLKGTDQVLVSDEPPGGSKAPTGSVIAGAKLS